MKILNTQKEILEQLLAVNCLCDRYNIVCDPTNYLVHHTFAKEPYANQKVKCPLQLHDTGSCDMFSRRQRALDKLEELKKLEFLENLE